MPMTILRGSITKKVRTRTVRLYKCIQFCGACKTNHSSVTRRYANVKESTAKLKFYAELTKMGWTRKGKDYICPKHTPVKTVEVQDGQ